MRHVPWVSDRAPPTTRGASDPRCRVQPSAARNGRHGPETRVAGSFVDTNFMSFFRNSDCVTKGATTAQRSVRSNKLMAGRSGLIRLRHLPLRIFRVHPSVCPYEMGVQQAPTASGCTRQPPVAGQCFPPIPPGQELREPAQCATSVPSVSTVRRAVRRSVWRRSVLFQRRRATVGAVHPAVGPANQRRRDYLADRRASRYPWDGGWLIWDVLSTTHLGYDTHWPSR